MKCPRSRCYRIALAAFALTACTEGPIQDPLPSAITDEIGGAPGGALAGDPERPCGYEFNHSFTTPSSQTKDHWVARITYNDAGLDVLEEAFDDSGQLVVLRTTEYNAMGQQLHYQEIQRGQTYHLWFAYDSFGRLIRYSGDYDDNGHEEWVATYGYGGDDRRISAHLALATVTYDRTYHYDESARLIQIDRDNGPDGSLDEITRFAYDDRARVINKIVSNSAGAVTVNGTATYDDSNRLISSVDNFKFEGGFTTVQAFDYTYSSDALLSQGYQFTHHDPAGALINDTRHRFDWRYSNCR